tara:strand:+ start:281 stop:874 length:594 start_codon:yes stop_codon:yes gene_type:complete
MPYTKDELKNIGFYNEFIDKLRSTYVSKLISTIVSENPFRDINGVLQSFEDITTSLGIEDNTEIRGDENYSTIDTLSVGIPEEVGDFADIIEENSCSIQNKNLKANLTDQTLDLTLDRGFTELIQIDILDPLPEELQNGDIVTNENFDDSRKWKIEANQKRPYPDLSTFLGSGIDFSTIKTVQQSIIDTVPTGEPMD